ncbi:MAG TPA: glycosyltransferase family 4 protein, partial [Acidobacteriaceae bacterium]
MRILLLNQFFWPDSSATSQLLTDLARGLLARGHQVSVISGDAGYALAESGEAPAVAIRRVKALPFGRGKAGRVFSYLSFYARAAFEALRVEKPDLVLTLTTPPLLPLLGTMLRRLRGARHYIWEMDLYPDVAIDVHYFRAGGLADRVVGGLADYTRHQAEGIVALGECMKDRLARRGIPREKISVAENWADGSVTMPVERPGDPDHLVILYSGNFGLAHDAETITGAIRSLAHHASIRFLFVGGGVRKAELALTCERERLTGVAFGSYVPRAQLG